MRFQDWSSSKANYAFAVKVRTCFAEPLRTATRCNFLQSQTKDKQESWPHLCSLKTVILRHNVRKAQGCHSLATKDILWLNSESIRILIVLFLRTDVDSCTSSAPIQLAHSKLYVVPRFIRSASQSVACCELVRLLKTAQCAAGLTQILSCGNPCYQRRHTG